MYEPILMEMLASTDETKETLPTRSRSKMKFVHHVRGIFRRELKAYMPSEKAEELFKPGSDDILSDYRYNLIDEDEAFFYLKEEYEDALAEYANEHEKENSHNSYKININANKLRETINTYNETMNNALEYFVSQKA